MAQGESELKQIGTDRTSSQPTDPGTGQPPRDQRNSDIALVEIAKLQNDAQYVRRDVDEMRKDMRAVGTDVRDVRERLAKLETKVDHLPGKGFIVVVVSTALVLVAGMLTVAPKVQAILAAPVAVAGQPPALPASSQPIQPGQ